MCYISAEHRWYRVRCSKCSCSRTAVHCRVWPFLHRLGLCLGCLMFIFGKVCYNSCGLSILVLHQLPLQFFLVTLLLLVSSFLLLYPSISWGTDVYNVSPWGAPLGTRIPTWKAAHIRLRKTCSSSIVENLMLLENSLHIQHLRMILQIHRKWEDYQWN